MKQRNTWIDPTERRLIVTEDYGIGLVGQPVGALNRLLENMNKPGFEARILPNQHVEPGPRRWKDPTMTKEKGVMRGIVEAIDRQRQASITPNTIFLHPTQWKDMLNYFEDE
jgi:hypothetical protein